MLLLGWVVRKIAAEYVTRSYPRHQCHIVQVTIHTKGFQDLTKLDYDKEGSARAPGRVWVGLNVLNPSFQSCI